MVTLTIHDVSDDVLRSLERQADAAGLSLNDYLVACLTLVAHQPPSDDGPSRLDHSEHVGQAETLATLTDDDAMRDITEGDDAYAHGDVVRGEDTVRALRPQDHT